MPVNDAARPSQRQWQREETALRIEQAALGVLVAVGYEAANAEQIAAAAAISVRTFFRYFPRGKEDVLVLESARIVDVFEAALRARPAAEPLFDALLAAAVATIRDGSTIEAGDAARLFGAIAVDDEALVARMIGERQLRLDALTPLLAERMGADPDRDVAPRMLAHSLHAALTVAWFSWLEGRRDDLLSTIEEVFGLLRPSIESGSPATPSR